MRIWPIRPKMILRPWAARRDLRFAIAPRRCQNRIFYTLSTDANRRLEKPTSVMLTQWVAMQPCAQMEKQDIWNRRYFSAKTRRELLRVDISNRYHACPGLSWPPLPTARHSYGCCTWVLVRGQLFRWNPLLCEGPGQVIGQLSRYSPLARKQCKRHGNPQGSGVTPLTHNQNTKELRESYAMV